jgi:hypothetical protein
MRFAHHFSHLLCYVSCDLMTIFCSRSDQWYGSDVYLSARADQWYVPDVHLSAEVELDWKSRLTFGSFFGRCWAGMKTDWYGSRHVAPCHAANEKTGCGSYGLMELSRPCVMHPMKKYAATREQHKKRDVSFTSSFAHFLMSEHLLLLSERLLRIFAHQSLIVSLWQLLNVSSAFHSQ